MRQCMNYILTLHPTIWLPELLLFKCLYVVMNEFAVYKEHLAIDRVYDSIICY